jgi:hypothetical protein
MLRRARPAIIMRPEIVEALQLFESATRVMTEAQTTSSLHAV